MKTFDLDELIERIGVENLLLYGMGLLVVVGFVAYLVKPNRSGEAQEKDETNRDSTEAQSPGDEPKA